MGSSDIFRIKMSNGYTHLTLLLPRRFRSEKATTKEGVTEAWNVTAAPRVPRQEGPKNPKARKTTEPPSQPTQSFKQQTQFQRSTSTAGKVSYVSLRFSCLKGATTYTGNLLRERELRACLDCEERGKGMLVILPGFSLLFTSRVPARFWVNVG